MVLATLFSGGSPGILSAFVCMCVCVVCVCVCVCACVCVCSGKEKINIAWELE